jgi:hypothetical protein
MRFMGATPSLVLYCGWADRRPLHTVKIVTTNCFALQAKAVQWANWAVQPPSPVRYNRQKRFIPGKNALQDIPQNLMG